MRESFWQLAAKEYGLRVSDKLTGARKAAAVAMVLASIESSHRALIASPLWLPIRKAIEDNPASFSEAMDIDLPDKPATKQRTMAQIFTSTGKGPQRDNKIATTAIPLRGSPSCDLRKPYLRKPESIPLRDRKEAFKKQSLSSEGDRSFKHSLSTLGTYQRLTTRHTGLFTNLLNWKPDTMNDTHPNFALIKTAPRLKLAGKVSCNLDDEISSDDVEYRKEPTRFDDYPDNFGRVFNTDDGYTRVRDVDPFTFADRYEATPWHD